MFTGTPELESKLDESFFLLQSNDACYASVKVYLKLLELFITNDGENNAEENVQKLCDVLRYVHAGN